jgi:hypothetical protein
MERNLILSQIKCDTESNCNNNNNNNNNNNELDLLKCRLSSTSAYYRASIKINHK